MGSRRVPWLPLGMALAVALVAALAGAVLIGGSPRDEAPALFSRVMSPFCPGLLLANCPSPQAETLREDIRQALGRGETPQAIEARLYAQFGDRIRAEPKASGIGLLAWVVPAAMLAATALWLVAWLRRARRLPDDPLAEASPPLRPDLLERLEDELAEL